MGAVLDRRSSRRAADPQLEQTRWRFGVVTVSDRCWLGVHPDRSGDLIVERCTSLPARLVSRTTVPDEQAAIRDAALAATSVADLVVLTGGTGLAPRDVTPQALAGVIDHEVPGMAEAMRARGLRSTAHAMLSRQLAGVRGSCLVLALPGGRAAVADCLDAVWEVLPHALALLAGAGADHPSSSEMPPGSPPAG